MSYSPSTISGFYAALDHVTSEISKLRSGQISMDAFALRPHFQQVLFTFREQCTNLRINEQQIDKMAYAVVASVDEAALLAGGELATFWMVSTLQFEYYGGNNAGTVFYENLEELLKNPAENSPALYLYYRMLALGFEGKYFGDRKGRETVIETCGRALIPFHAARMPEQQAFAEPKKVESSSFFIPGWVYAVTAAAIIILVWLLNMHFMKESTKQTLGSIQTETETAAPDVQRKAGK